MGVRNNELRHFLLVSKMERTAIDVTKCSSQNAVLSCDKTQTKNFFDRNKEKKRSDNLRSLCQK